MKSPLTESEQRWVYVVPSRKPAPFFHYDKGAFSLGRVGGYKILPNGTMRVDLPDSQECEVIDAHAAGRFLAEFAAYEESLKE